MELAKIINRAFNDAAQGLAPRRSPRFALPMTNKQVEYLLLKAYAAEVQDRGGEFAPSAVSDHIKGVAEWLTSRERRPWLLLAGGLGSGKTTISVSVVKVCEQLAKSFGREGRERTEQMRRACLSDAEIQIFDAAARAVPSPSFIPAAELARIARDDEEAFRRIEKCGFLILDDLGTEPVEAKTFGNSILPAVEVLLSRYQSKKPTIITTNLSEQAITERYGARITDRLRELAEVIAFENPSFRKWD